MPSVVHDGTTAVGAMPNCFLKAVEKCDWETLAAIMAELAPVIAQFFNDVLVMDKDPEIRANRIALLSACQKFFMQIGDFSILK